MTPAHCRISDKMEINESEQIKYKDYISYRNKNEECSSSSYIILKSIDNKISNQTNNQLERNKGKCHLFEPGDDWIDSNCVNNFLSNNKEQRKEKNNGKSKILHTPDNKKMCNNKYTYHVKNTSRSKFNSKLTSNEKNCSDKTTYCRPLIHLYNEEFTFKTMERNARLKNLVKKMALARQREKENTSWNNFINTLKNKHNVNNLKYSEIQHHKCPGIIEDLYNTKFSTNNEPRLCADLLDDFYYSYDNSQPNYLNCRLRNSGSNINSTQRCNFYKYGDTACCYPTSSQGRLMLLRREQQRNQCRKSINLDSITNLRNRKLNCAKGIQLQYRLNNNKTSSAQADFKTVVNFTQNKFKDKATAYIDEPPDLTKTNLKNLQQNLKRVSLQNIEAKLSTLIESINIFIDEIRVSKVSDKGYNLKCNNKGKNGLKFTENKITQEINYLSPKEEANSYGSIFKALTIDNTINTKCSNSHQIPFEEPTRDCYTEITKSISKQDVREGFNKITNTLYQNNCIIPRMTIAVNTDPLSFLALLKISADTLKRLFSYIPILNNYQYLRLPSAGVVKYLEDHYVCNICGTHFETPLALGDHIAGHKFGEMRNYCVCRYVLDRVRRQSLFRCKYCGQCFTRAYCCELHQKSCSKQSGNNRNESDLILLK